MKGWKRARRCAIAFTVAALFALPALPAPAIASTRAPSCSVPSGTLMTMDGSVGWSRHPNARRRVASTIKMLNALVVRENASLDDTVAVAAKAARISWNGGVGLVKGQVLTVRQLLNMMLIASANDAAEALAIHIGGSQKAYVAMMNAKAKELGLTHTHAIDPHGLSEKETSTASDLSVLARQVMADPVLRAIVRKHSVRVPRPHMKTKTVKSTDLLLGHYTGIEGVKTGYTSTAGYCFVGAAKRGDVELLGVVMGAKSLAARFSQMRNLLDWGFKHCHSRTLVSRETTIGVVPVAGCPLLSVTVHPEETATVALFDSDAPIVTSVTLEPTVSGPVSRGQRLGTVTVSRGGTVVAEVPLVSDVEVTPQDELPEATFRRMLGPQ